jgi:hypothetical protein
MWLELPSSRELLRGGCGEIRTKKIFKWKGMMGNFTWDLGSRDKVKCEVSLMEDKK